MNICGFRVGECECDCDFTFAERLLGCMPVLKTITINFDPSINVSEERFEDLLCLSGPDTCMKIYSYCNGAKVMYTPVGRDASFQMYGSLGDPKN